MTDEYSRGSAVQPGTVFGSYRVVSELGRGGMGVVYLTEHTIMGKQAAVKVLLPEYSGREDLVLRFFNEARAAARLDHPAFVEVFDCGVARDCAYMVMEYIHGDNLTVCLKRETRFPVAQAIKVARFIADAMAIAHDSGIVHRDLKPDNIILATLGKGARTAPHPVKILDFGIAKLNVGSSDSRITKTGTLMGTPLYMSPEQCRGAGTLDARSDIYSLGCILYAMLTGTPPFPREGDGVVLVAHIVDEVPSFESHGLTLPAALEAAVMKALAKEPDDRQQSMIEFSAELAAADATPGRETAPGRAELVSGARQQIEVLPSAPAPAKAAEPPRVSAAVPAAAKPNTAVTAPAKPKTAVTAPAKPNTAVTAPDRPAAAPSAAAAAKAAPAVELSGTTTFSRTTGQVTAVTTKTRRARRSPLVAGGAMAIGVVAAVLLTRGGRPHRPPVATPAVTATAAPVSAPAPAATPPAAPAPTPAATPPPVPATPPASAEVSVKIASEPARAVVYDADGNALGVTPVTFARPRSATSLQLRLEKRGFLNETVKVTLDADVEKTVTLRPRPRPVAEPDEMRKL